MCTYLSVLYYNQERERFHMYSKICITFINTKWDKRLPRDKRRRVRLSQVTFLRKRDGPFLRLSRENWKIWEVEKKRRRLVRFWCFFSPDAFNSHSVTPSTFQVAIYIFFCGKKQRLRGRIVYKYCNNNNNNILLKIFYLMLSWAGLEKVCKENASIEIIQKDIYSCACHICLVVIPFSLHKGKKGKI